MQDTCKFILKVEYDFMLSSSMTIFSLEAFVSKLTKNKNGMQANITYNSYTPSKFVVQEINPTIQY